MSIMQQKDSEDCTYVVRMMDLEVDSFQLRSRAHSLVLILHVIVS